MQGKQLVRFGFLILVCTALMAAAQSVAQSMGQLRYVAREPIVLHDGAGAVEFTLANIGVTPVPLTLRLSPFSDETSQITLATPKVTFGMVNGSNIPARVDPSQAIQVEVSVSDLRGSSAASATLFNGDTELGKVHVLEADAPFDVSVTGDGSADHRLVLSDGDTASITLKNSDGDAYPVDWDFQIDGRSLQSGELELAPHGSASIDLIPTSDLYSWIDAVRPSDKTGVLTLAVHGPPTVPKEVLPSRTLTVNVKMMKLGTGWTRVCSYLFVTLVLLLGGLLSLMANTILPNIVRKAQLRRQINGLTDRTNSVSSHVDSYLRTLLRLEQKRIDVMLKRIWVASLSAAESLEEISVACDRLSGRLKVTERLDELRRKFDEASMTAPPSVTEGIDNKLQTAANHLQPFVLTEDDVSAAIRFLDAADTSLAMLTDTDALARLIASNFRDLKLRQKYLPHSYYNDLKAALPGLFEMLNQPFDDFRNIPHPMIFAVDYGIAALQMAFDFAVLRASAPSAVLDPNSTESPSDRLAGHQKELISLLGTLSWAALRDLRTLVQEMRENIYERDVLEQIATRGQAEIVFEPQTVRPYQLVLFSIRFKDPRFNEAAAIRRLTNKWDFPNEVIEQDWKICHFFQGNELHRGEGRDISVSVRVESQKPADVVSPSNGARPLRTVLSTTFELYRSERPSYSYAFAEGVRFMISFGVALAVLLSGTLQQLDKLDFLPASIAILAVGFGADSIKNLLMQTTKKIAS